MIYRKLFVPAVIVGIAAAAAVPFTLADEAKDAAVQPQMKLPPGWTQEDMQATIAAATPGKMHEFLQKDVGIWKGKNTMWMSPGADPVSSDSTATLTPMMGGRFVKCEVAGEMPGMGPYTGLGIYGFDNVSQKFVYMWIDNSSTGIANGTGDLSSDGKTLTWNITFNCPITKKPQTIREVDTFTGPDSKTIEMFGADPKSGKEFEMIKVELTRQ
ncbi:MAG TPA: DUF1579 domain-containing protein [Phycisphaerae bacterium]|nr:DUF1579 domain-containing protein [Phycisphaerae bacterium]